MSDQQLQGARITSRREPVGSPIELSMPSDQHGLSNNETLPMDLSISSGLSNLQSTSANMNNETPNQETFNLSQNPNNTFRPPYCNEAGSYRSTQLGPAQHSFWNPAIEQNSSYNLTNNILRQVPHNNNMYGSQSYQRNSQVVPQSTHEICNVEDGQQVQRFGYPYNLNGPITVPNHVSYLPAVVNTVRGPNDDRNAVPLQGDTYYRPQVKDIIPLLPDFDPAKTSLKSFLQNVDRVVNLYSPHELVLMHAVTVKSVLWESRHLRNS